MTTSVQSNYGINTVTVGRVSVTTIKLRVNADFPFTQLPVEVAYLPTGRGKYTLKYEGTGETARTVVQGVIKALREHAQRKLNQKYARMTDPIQYAYDEQFVAEQNYWEQELQF